MRARNSHVLIMWRGIAAFPFFDVLHIPYAIYILYFGSGIRIRTLMCPQNRLLWKWYTSLFENHWIESTQTWANSQIAKTECQHISETAVWELRRERKVRKTRVCERECFHVFFLFFFVFFLHSLKYVEIPVYSGKSFKKWSRQITQIFYFSRQIEIRYLKTRDYLRNLRNSLRVRFEYLCSFEYTIYKSVITIGKVTDIASVCLHRRVNGTDTRREKVGRSCRHLRLFVYHWTRSSSETMILASTCRTTRSSRIYYMRYVYICSITFNR